jgi:molybdenum cofactor cytidylyltransferase
MSQESDKASARRSAALGFAVVLVAAGLSNRMGARNKLLIEIGGESLVRRTARAYLEAGGDVHVVVGYEADAVRAALAGLPVGFTENPRFADGQATSVRAGLESLPEGYRALIVALADQAALTSGDIRDLVKAFAESDRRRILIPYYRGERGNPVVFPPEIIAKIRAGGPDLTARKFIDSNPQLTRCYEAANDHFVIDIDTPEDLERFRAKMLGT